MMYDIHSINKTDDGTFELKCRGELFAKVTSAQIWDWKQPEKIFDVKLREHIVEEHPEYAREAEKRENREAVVKNEFTSAGEYLLKRGHDDAPIHGGTEDTGADTENSLRNKLSRLVTAAKPLAVCTAGWGQLGYPSPPTYTCLDRERDIIDPRHYTTNWFPREKPCINCELLRVIKDMRV